jgi:alkanesulfonate monooxygenase SsuD/methylene tetrahydromethanopterin reductase-like flavin-dependent oxidoreductase (luciferase family)
VSPNQQWDEHLQMTETAVGYVFDLVMVGQHFIPQDLRYYQPIPYLAALAGRFPEVRVGTGIALMTLARPIEIAESMATLDLVSAGRAVFGVGLGYTDVEFAALGMPKSARVERLVQGLDIVRSLWHGEPTEHHGIFGDFAVARPIVRPVQQPHPPIWLAAQAPAAVRRAARIADAWYPPPFLDHAELRRMTAAYLEARAESGLGAPVAMPIRREVYLADTVEQARAIAGPLALRRTATYLRWGLSGEMAGGTAMHSETAENIDRRFLLGPPGHVADELQALREEVVMTDFVYRCQWPGMSFADTMSQLHRFGSEVVSRFRP